MGLIEERHPAFKRLIGLWRDAQSDELPPPADALCRRALGDLARVTVVLAQCEGDDLIIAESGEMVDALYGEPLTGRDVASLSAARGDAAEEARSAVATGRPLLIEDEMAAAPTRRRIARLYLPLSKEDGSRDGVLCGIVATA